MLLHILELPSILSLNNIALYAYVCIHMCVYHIFFIHSSVRENLHNFHILAIVKDAVMNIRMLLCLLKSKFKLFLDKYPDLGLQDHMVVLVLF